MRATKYPVRVSGLAMGVLLLSAGLFSVHGRDAAASEVPSTEQDERDVQERADGADDVRALVQRLKAISGDNPRQVMAVLNEVKKVGCNSDIVNTLVEVMFRYDAYFYYPDSTTELGEDGEIVTTHHSDHVYRPLQWKVARTLVDIVPPQSAPRVEHLPDSEHEWAAELWRAWWRGVQKQEYATLPEAVLREHARGGDVPAVLFLADRKGQAIMPWLLTLLGDAEGEFVKQVTFHMGLAVAGRNESLDWLLVELQAVPLDEVHRERILLEALQNVGASESIIDVMLQMMELPEASDYRTGERMIDYAPPRDYLIARALASMVDDPDAPSLRSMTIYDRHSAVRRWLEWGAAR